MSLWSKLKSSVSRWVSGARWKQLVALAAVTFGGAAIITATLCGIGIASSLTIGTLGIAPTAILLAVIFALELKVAFDLGDCIHG